MISWLFVLTSIGGVRLWWSLVLRSVLASGTIAEGLKFLFFQIDLCGRQVTNDSGEDARSGCSLARDGWFGVVAAVLFFLSAILTFVKQPEMRELDEGYGVDDDNGNGKDDPYGTEDIDNTNIDRTSMRGGDAPADDGDFVANIFGWEALRIKQGTKR